VRVMFETEYAADGSILPRGRLVENVSVEVLEPADDPSEDLNGTIRRNPVTSQVVVAVQMPVAGDERWRSVSGNYYLTDDEVVGWPVTGTVPGTPAADQRPGPRPMEIPLPEWERNLLEQGPRRGESL
jgi:hypothetical protein